MFNSFSSRKKWEFQTKNLPLVFKEREVCLPSNIFLSQTDSASRLSLGCLVASPAQWLQPGESSTGEAIIPRLGPSYLHARYLTFLDGQTTSNIPTTTAPVPKSPKLRRHNQVPEASEPLQQPSLWAPIHLVQGYKVRHLNRWNGQGACDTIISGGDHL